MACAMSFIESVANLDAALIQCERGLTRLYIAPQRVVYNPKLWHLCHQPFMGRIELGASPSTLRILYEPLPVPHQTTDIHLVVEQSCAAVAIAVDGRSRPGRASGTGHPLCV